MAHADTSLGGGDRRFPETTWGMVARLRDASPEGYRSGLETFCRRYWKPAYRYIRAAWSKSNEEAKDLAQAFFLWLLDAETLRQYAPEKGGFRPFLKLLLRRFVGHQEVALARLKRGGGTRILPIEESDVAAEPGETDPERIFDRAWIREVVNQAIDRVRAQSEALVFRVYEEYDLSPSPPTYSELALQLGIPEKDVRKHLFDVRERVRTEIRAELTRLTADPKELEEEWNGLFR